MKFKKHSEYSMIFLGMFILVMFSSQIISAYPGFGKKINPVLIQSCGQCHVAFPKLRLYGRTTREIGYQVPIAESDDGLIKSIYRSVPIGIRGKMDVADTDNGKSMLTLVQFLSSGTVLNDKVAWWFHKHLYDIEDDQDSKLFDTKKIIPLNEGQPHEAWLQYNHSTALNVRAGVFELPFWFSPVKTKVGESDYLAFGANGNPDMSGTLASPQFGIALNGYLSKGTSEDDWGESEDNYAEGYNYAITVTSGKAEFPQNSELSMNTFFGRITKKEYSYAAGLWALAGKAEITHQNEHNDHLMKSVETSSENVHFERYYRFGTDIDLFIRGDDINIYGSLVYGNDIDRDFVGGFLGYDHLFHPKIFGLVRYDGVFFISGDAMGEMDNPHDENGDDHGEEENGGHAHGVMIMDDASSFSAGIFYLPFANVRVGFEYVYQLNGNIGQDIHDIGGKGIFQIQFGF